VLYLMVVKQCMDLCNVIICIRVIFFGAYCVLSSPNCRSQSDKTHCSSPDRSLTTQLRQLQMLSNQLLPTNFLAEEPEFHPENIAYLCSQKLLWLFYSTESSYNTKYLIFLWIFNGICHWIHSIIILHLFGLVVLLSQDLLKSYTAYCIRAVLFIYWSCTAYCIRAVLFIYWSCTAYCIRSVLII
jgi:hypothetical protein